MKKAKGKKRVKDPPKQSSRKQREKGDGLRCSPCAPAPPANDSTPMSLVGYCSTAPRRSPLPLSKAARFVFNLQKREQTGLTFVLLLFIFACAHQCGWSGICFFCNRFQHRPEQIDGTCYRTCRGRTTQIARCIVFLVGSDWEYDTPSYYASLRYNLLHIYVILRIN